MFELKEEKKVSVKLYGEVYELSPMTFGESFGAAMADQRDVKASIEQLKSTLISRGLPAEVLEKMPIEHVNLLVEHLAGKKK